MASLICTLKEAETKWLTADPHYGHRAILKYCDRPFKTVWEMNDTLIKNWNKLVQWGDDGYILGDFGMRHPFEYLWQLHGNVTIIRGNHDREIPRCLMKPYEFIMVDSVKFLLIHNYLNAYETGLVPPDWEGWIIFGHHHKKQPFMRRYMNRRLINVSVEVTDYKPISLARLVELIKNGEGK